MHSLIKADTQEVNYRAKVWLGTWKTWTEKGLAEHKAKIEKHNAEMSRFQRWMTGKTDVSRAMRWAKNSLRYSNLAEKIAAIERASREGPHAVRVFVEADVFAALYMIDEYFGEPYEIRH